MDYSFTDMATRKIEEVLNGNGVNDPHGTTLKILRIVFDELFTFLDCKGVVLPRIEVGEVIIREDVK